MANNKPLKGIVKPDGRITKGGRMSPTAPVTQIVVPKKNVVKNVPKEKKSN